MKSEYLDLFDGYFSGSLDEGEQLELEGRLRTDLNVREAFHEYQDLRKGIDYSIMKTLKEELQQLEANLPEVVLEPGTKSVTMEAPVKNKFTLYKIAAVVLLVAASAVVLFQLDRTSDPQDLFSQYFEPAENAYVSVKRGDDINVDPKVRAFQAYDNGDFGVAIQGFNEILAQQEDVMILFYLGNAQMANHQSQAAVGTFERFLEISEDSVSDAKWYLALSYLDQQKVEEARILLEDLKTGAKHSQQAGEILGKLE